MTGSVAMVFVSTDEGPVLLSALESLFSASIDRSLEVIVVDNASVDGARDEIARRWPGVKILVRTKNHGLPSNLNHGITASSSQFVMLCNSDLIFGESSVENLARFLDEHPRAGIAAPKLLSPKGEVRPSARRWYTVPVLLALRGPWRNLAGRLRMVQRNLYEDWDYRGPLQVDWVPCPATMMRRAALDEVGFMDERFRLYFDDVDISLRMHRGGWEVWCVPSAEVVHLEQRASVTPFSKAWRWHLASLLKFWWKHRSLRPRP